MDTLQYNTPTKASSTGNGIRSRSSIREKVLADASPYSNSSSTVFVIGEDTAAASWIAGLAKPAGHRMILHRSAEDFLNSYDGTMLGCIICDIRLPGMSGLELLWRIMERMWDIPVIMMSTCADVQTVVLALKNGAIDFIDKKPSEPIMLDLIHNAVSLHTQRSMKRVEWSNLQAQISKLTPREHEVMQLVVEGWPNKAIAGDLGVSTKTVEAHRAHMMKKMAVRSLPDLVRMAIRARELQNSYIHENHSGIRAHLR